MMVLLLSHRKRMLSSLDTTVVGVFFLLLGVVHLLGQLSILLHFFKLSKDSVHVALEMFYTHTFIWCKLTPLKQSK